MSVELSAKNINEWDFEKSKYTQLPNCINDLLFDDYIEDWYMTQQERCTLITLLNKIKPEHAIEVGTLFGGSLSLISRFSNHVYSLDIDPACREKLSGQFANVEFITGDSNTTLPQLVKQLQDDEIPLEFALIDASHTREGVRNDIENLLEYKPIKPFYIVIHDSFMPNCRLGMAEANWAKSPYVHLVELDFVPGRFNVDENDPVNHKKMTCGLAIALLLPFKRTGDIKMLAHEELPYNILKDNSIHSDSFMKTFKTTKRKVGRAVNKFKRYWVPVK